MTDIMLNVKLPIFKKKGHSYVASEYKLKVKRLVEEATAKGENFYFTGEPCKHGHENPKRYVKNGHCLECAKINKQKNKGKYKNKVKEYYKNNKLRLRVQTYGLTVDQFDKLYDDQKGQCVICLTDLLEGSKTHIDHCKETKKVRGILCRNCNVAIGHLRHNPELLRKAALYCED
ncbi:MAG: endonuclease VII domain-containing protein [Bacteroidota bacterium]